MVLRKFVRCLSAIRQNPPSDLTQDEREFIGAQEHDGHQQTAAVPSAGPHHALAQEIDEFLFTVCSAGPAPASATLPYRVLPQTDKLWVSVKPLPAKPPPNPKTFTVADIRQYSEHRAIDWLRYFKKEVNALRCTQFHLFSHILIARQKLQGDPAYADLQAAVKKAGAAREVLPQLEAQVQRKFGHVLRFH